MSEDVITLNDPRREEILAEIQGDFKKLNRLQSVASPLTIDGHRFPSKKEANHYTDLKLKERAGKISHLQLQVRFPLVVNDVPVFPRGYYADFVYLELQEDKWRSWKLVVEDSKGVKTDIFRVKANLVKAIYGITIRES